MQEEIEIQVIYERPGMRRTSTLVLENTGGMPSKC